MQSLALSKLTSSPLSGGPEPLDRPHGRVGLAAAAVIATISVYKALISPLCTGCCRFIPSCSDYMVEAVRTHGAAKGILLGLRRLSRCRPMGRYGVDPVPRD